LISVWIFYFLYENKPFYERKTSKNSKIIWRIEKSIGKQKYDINWKNLRKSRSFPFIYVLWNFREKFPFLTLGKIFSKDFLTIFKKIQNHISEERVRMFQEYFIRFFCTALNSFWIICMQVTYAQIQLINFWRRYKILQNQFFCLFIVFYVHFWEEVE